MKRTLASAVAAAAIGLGGSFDLAAQSQPGPAREDSLADHGRYLVKIAGCNDCHTPGYMANAGKVDEKIWLTGDRLGWSGPWGTTYAVNLRLYMKSLTEAQWLNTARNMKARPPMPWFALEAMSDRDLRAIYEYVKTLGPAGEPAPAYLPPGEAPKGPFVRFR
ncbi:MAG TPA: c-type cytochrome [Burkholderiales bacterium]|nr:c-type cytochrome [Burkholderiales bacterium]